MVGVDVGLILNCIDNFVSKKVVPYIVWYEKDSLLFFFFHRSTDLKARSNSFNFNFDDV